MNIFYKRTARLCCGFLAIASGVFLSGVDLNAGRLQRAKELSNRPKPPVRPKGFLANISRRTEKGYALLAVAGLATLGIVGYSIYAANNEPASDGDSGLPEFPGYPGDTGDTDDSPVDPASVVASDFTPRTSYSSAYPAPRVPGYGPSTATPASGCGSASAFMPPAPSTICCQAAPSPASSSSEQSRRDRLKKEAEEQRLQEERLRRDREAAEQRRLQEQLKEDDLRIQERQKKAIETLFVEEERLRANLLAEEQTYYALNKTHVRVELLKVREKEQHRLKLVQQEEYKKRLQEERFNAACLALFQQESDYRRQCKDLESSGWSTICRHKNAAHTALCQQIAVQIDRKRAAERLRQEEQERQAKKQAELAQQQGLKQKLEAARSNLDKPISQDLWNEVSKVLNSTWTDTFGHQRRIHFCSGDSYPGSIVAGARTGCDAPAVPNQYTPQWWATASVQEINTAKQEHQQLVKQMAAEQKAEAERLEQEKREAEVRRQKTDKRYEMVKNLVDKGVYLQLKQDFTCQGFELKEVFGFQANLIPDCFDILPGWQGQLHFQGIQEKSKSKSQLFLNWIYYNYQLDKQGLVVGFQLEPKLLESVQDFMRLYEDFYNQKLRDLRAGYGSGDQGVPPQGPSAERLMPVVNRFYQFSDAITHFSDAEVKQYQVWLQWLDRVLAMFLKPHEYANLCNGGMVPQEKEGLIQQAIGDARVVQQRRQVSLQAACVPAQPQRMACARR